MVSTTHKLKVLAHLLYVYKSVFFYFNSLAYVVLSYIAFPVYVCSHVTGAYLLYGRSLQGAVQRSRWVDQMSFYANLQEPRQLQTPNNFHRTSEQKYNKLFTQHMTKCTSWLNHIIQNRINGIFSSCSFVSLKSNDGQHIGLKFLHKMSLYFWPYRLYSSVDYILTPNRCTRKTHFSDIWNIDFNIPMHLTGTLDKKQLTSNSRTQLWYLTCLLTAVT